MVTAVETGIGYPTGTFAKFKIYESYACMHAYQGIGAAANAGETHWYDAVIPNAFDLSDFDYRYHGDKHDYFLFLGRQNVGKGIHIAKDMACKLDIPLCIAGQGTQGEDNKWVRYLGILNPQGRRDVLSRARFTVCASTFLEPFCGVQIESMISGTPVISSDWGAFAEYNKHGVTGYRCRTFEQFMWAANHIDRIDPENCRAWGEKFSLENIAPRYTDYLQSVQDVISGKGFYEPHPERTTLLNSSNFSQS
jgi:glycosyltransferase involved in cell wall biosynthesis